MGGKGKIRLMKISYLEFEQPIADVEAKIEQLRFAQDDSAVDISEEIARIEAKSQSLAKDIYAKLTPWQCA
jgi:acetyl-CoA carboxylase carboxyl transferase subunit alpha